MHATWIYMYHKIIFVFTVHQSVQCLNFWLNLCFFPLLLGYTCNSKKWKAMKCQCEHYINSYALPFGNVRLGASIAQAYTIWDPLPHTPAVEYSSVVWAISPQFLWNIQDMSSVLFSFCPSPEYFDKQIKKEYHFALACRRHGIHTKNGVFLNEVSIF